ncbi:MAG: GNAT family N-acetyltransferase [Bacillus sp. (in: firmicutes)]
MAVGDVDEVNKADVHEANRLYFQTSLVTGDFIAWIAEVNKEIVVISGLVFFTRPPHAENMKGLAVYIMNMYTKPGFRKKGMARSLLEACVSDCRCSGAGRIWLHASEEGRGLYKHLGFSDNESEMELLVNGANDSDQNGEVSQ